MTLGCRRPDESRDRSPHGPQLTNDDQSRDGAGGTFLAPLSVEHVLMLIRPFASMPEVDTLPTSESPQA